MLLFSNSYLFTAGWHFHVERTTNGAESLGESCVKSQGYSIFAQPLKAELGKLNV